MTKKKVELDAHQQQKADSAEQSAKPKVQVYNKDGTPKTKILKADPYKDEDGNAV